MLICHDPENVNLEQEPIEVRTLSEDDLDWVVAIDESHTGRARREYYRVKLREAAADTGMRISLAAAIDGRPAGFLLGRLYYGEFGRPEPSAILDSIGVAPAYRGHGVGRVLMQKLQDNLHALGIEMIETQVSWTNTELLRFFQKEGFAPSGALCLELRLGRR